MTIANVNIRQILLKKGNTARNQNYTGPIGEITLDTDLNTIRVHNGVTAGGVNILATQAQIDTLTSSISTITGLDANLVANIGSLLANAASQQTTINSLLANAASQQTQIANITTGTATFGNLLPTANVTYSLGSPTQQWKDLYISSNTIYIAGIPLRVDTNGNLTINGNSVGGSNGSVTNTGDLAFVGHAMYNFNGAVIENADLTHGATSAVIIPANGTTDPLQLNNYTGTVDITSGPDSENTKVWSFGTDGSLTFPLVNGQTNIQQQRYGMGNVVAYNDGGWAIGEFNGTDYGTEGIRLSPGIEGSVEVILPANQDAAANPLQLNNYSGNVQINANNNYWRFGADGHVTFPDNTVQTTAFTGQGGSNPLIWNARAISSLNASNTQAVAYDSQGNSFALMWQGPWNSQSETKSTVVKLDSVGNTVWVKDFADGNTVNPWSLTCDDSDNLYVIVQRYTGSAWNNVVMKLQGSDGSILWQVDIQDSQGSNNMQAIAYNVSGLGSGVIVAGTAYNGNDHDFFVTGINSDGTVGTATTWGDQWDQQAYGLAFNNTNGDIVLVGRKQSNTDNAYYLEMVKFQFNGTVAWQKSVTVDGVYDVQGTDVCLLPNGNWAIAASHAMSNGNYGVITMTVNNVDGSVIWSKEIANGCTNISSSIAADSQGHIYVSASTYAGSNSLNNAPILSRLLGAYDTDGNVVWQKYLRAPGDNWLIDNNWWNGIGSTGKVLAVHGDRLLVGSVLAPLGNSGPVTSYGLVTQLSTAGEDEIIGFVETRNSYLTDAAVSLTFADTTFDFTTATQTLALGSSVSMTTGTLTYTVDHPGAQISQLISGQRTVALQTNGLLVAENGRNITGELDRHTDSGNFGNLPIAIKNASGYKRILGLDSTAQTWITLNELGTQLGINPRWINGAIIEYQVFSTNISWQGSMVGQIIIASNQNYEMNVSHTETAITTSGGNPGDVTFSNLDLWHVNSSELQARRTDSGSGQQLDITWTARVFVNASEWYC